MKPRDGMIHSWASPKPSSFGIDSSLFLRPFASVGSWLVGNNRAHRSCLIGGLYRQEFPGAAGRARGADRNALRPRPLTGLFGWGAW